MVPKLVFMRNCWIVVKFEAPILQHCEQIRSIQCVPIIPSQPVLVNATVWIATTACMIHAWVSITPFDTRYQVVRYLSVHMFS